jgi:transposase, IS30 family
MPGLPLSLLERDEISVALIEDRTMSWAAIGRRVNRDPTTIAREVAGGGGRDRYRPTVADRDAHRRLRRPRRRVLATAGVLRDRVTRELRQGRSPEAIWADHVADGLAVPCVESIYMAVYAGVLGVKPTECLRMRRPRRKSRQERHSSRRPALPNIGTRPAAVNDRSQVGHWEADMIVGTRNRSAMLWLTERVTRFSIPVTMPEGYTADQTLAGLIEALEQIPAHLRLSITFDQGSEWANWESLALTYELQCWFCDPHSPWQRGQVENLNRQWRWWFPRGTRLDNIATDTAQHAADTINGQRRRSLAYQSPTMLYSAAIVQ